MVPVREAEGQVKRGEMGRQMRGEGKKVRKAGVVMRREGGRAADVTGRAIYRGGPDVPPLSQ